MRRTSWRPWLLAAASAGLFVSCTDDEAVDAVVDAGDPSTPFEPPPDEEHRVDAGLDPEVPPGDAAAPPDAGDDPWPDPEPPRDGGPSHDCVEEFVWDPEGRSDVDSVVVASGYLSNWSAASSPALTLGDDGLWRASIPMVALVMPYKFVVNGSEWLADPGACHTVSDGFGGHNSVRYACQEAPACPQPEDAGVESDAGSDASVDAGHDELDASAEPDAAAPDAAASDAAMPAEDAGSAELDASPGADAGAAADAGSEDECPCSHTVWIDLDGKPGVFADDILEVVLAGNHAALGSWDPGYSAVVLTPA
jgi:hypothetical protein